METLWQDVKYGLRMLRQKPGFTFVALLTLALGIGANTAIFSVVKAVVLNQLPYHQPERLVFLAEIEPGSVRPETVDFTTVHDWRTRSRSFEHLSLYRFAAGAIVEQGEPELIRGMRVNYDFFDTLGVKMHLGRAFLAEEDAPDRRYVVVLSHSLWVRRFGGDPNIVGRVLRLSDASFTVVGVAPAGFRSIGASVDDAAPEMFLPLGYTLSGPSSCRGCQHLHLIGRLKAGVSLEAARDELNGIMRDLVREHPNEYHPQTGAIVVPLQDALVGRVRTALWVLLGAVGFVLLIACANVANLLLARATVRSSEIAVRAALGAGPYRLIRQLLTESLLLALGGGVLGVVIALWGTSALTAFGPREIPRLDEITLDTPVLLFSLAVTLLTGVLFGMVPALRAARMDLNETLKGAGKSTEGRSRHLLRNLLVTAELALAFVLVVGAGLLAMSFLRLSNVDPGYDPRNVLTLNTYVYGERYRNAEVELGYYNQAMEKVRAIPGVESVAMVSTLPLSGFDRRGFHIQDRRLASEAEAPSVDAYSVSPEYFRVMRIPLKRGRIFTEQDRANSPRVAVISETCAQMQFPGENALGKNIQLGGRNEDRPWATIVGIVGDVRQYGLDRPANMSAYIAQAQDTSFGYNVVVRTSKDPQQSARAVRNAFLAADGTQPIFNVKPLETYLQTTLAERTFTLFLLSLLGALALALAAVGIYGVISYAVSLRTREVGIRMALGAQRGDVVRLILHQGFRLLAAGMGIGLVAALATTRVMGTMLFEVKPTDPLTFIAVAAGLGAITVLACYLPARRAARVDPMVALRYE